MNAEHLEMLASGPERWNAWRAEHPQIRPDLSGLVTDAETQDGIWYNNAEKSFFCSDPVMQEYIRAEMKKYAAPSWGLHYALVGYDLRGVNLSGATIACSVSGSRFDGADLSGSVLFNSSDILEASWIGANLSGAILPGIIDAPDLRGPQ